MKQKQKLIILSDWRTQTECKSTYNKTVFHFICIIVIMFASTEQQQSH